MLGDRMKRAMLLNGINQKELAKRLNTTEVSVSRYINGIREPKARVIRDMAAVLKVPTDYLLEMDATRKEE